MLLFDISPLIIRAFVYNTGFVMNPGLEVNLVAFKVSQFFLFRLIQKNRQHVLLWLSDLLDFVNELNVCFDITVL